jgi:hypothetical protein
VGHRPFEAGESEMQKKIRYRKFLSEQWQLEVSMRLIPRLRNKELKKNMHLKKGASFSVWLSFECERASEA